MKLDRFLNAEESRQLVAEHMPSLLELNGNYTRHIDPENNIPLTPLYVDYLRTSWRLDRSDRRAQVSVATQGLGLAFGVLLAACTDLRWAIAEDAGGAFFTLAKEGVDAALVSVPPFSFVQKRHDVESAEVFQEFFEQISPELIGFRRPSNWLLDDEAT